MLHIELIGNFMVLFRCTPVKGIIRCFGESGGACALRGLFVFGHCCFRIVGDGSDSSRPVGLETPGICWIGSRDPQQFSCIWGSRRFPVRAGSPRGDGIPDADSTPVGASLEAFGPLQLEHIHVARNQRLKSTQSRVTHDRELQIVRSRRNFRMKKVPLGDKVVVKRLDAEAGSPAAVSPCRTVFSTETGGGPHSQGGRRSSLERQELCADLSVSEGDRVMFSSGAGTEVSADGQELLIMNDIRHPGRDFLIALKNRAEFRFKVAQEIETRTIVKLNTYVSAILVAGAVLLVPFTTMATAVAAEDAPATKKATPPTRRTQKNHATRCEIPPRQPGRRWQA